MGSSLLLFVSAAACLAVLSPVADGKFVVTSYPETIIPGVTQHMVISCYIANYPNHGIMQVKRLDLVLCKNVACEEKDNILLASADTSPDSVTVNRFNVNDGFNDGAQVSGDVSQLMSYLNLAWIHLEGDMSGRYKCIVHGMDKSGNNALLWDFADVWGIHHHDDHQDSEGAVPEEAHTHNWGK